MHLEPGTVLDDRYTVLAAVSRGGMGAVYKASDRRLAGAVCALKMMHGNAELGAGVGFIQRCFEKEVSVLTTLRHPGIPRVQNFFMHDHSLCIVMDFIEGENLEQVRRRGEVSTGYLLDVAEQVLHILHYLHTHNPSVIHRDVKPANLILQADTKRIILVDFGLARAGGGNGAGSLTAEAGTVGYSPVEQLQGEAEERSDLYSLGATMHYLVAGKLPPIFCVPHLATVVPTVPQPLAALVDHAVQMQLRDRFTDAASMLEAVEHTRQLLSGPILAPPFPDVEAAAVPKAGAEVILVVDDDATIRACLVRILEREMYRVVLAETGEEALEIAMRDTPDLILSDIEMPGMSGLALCRKLQSHRLTREVPVMLLTGRADVEDEALGLDSGAVDYIAKPIVAARLVARVHAVLRRTLSR